MKKIMRLSIKFSLVLLFWLFVWQLAAFIVGEPPKFSGNITQYIGQCIIEFFTDSGNLLLLPGPIPVFKRFFELAVTWGFWQTALISLSRVGIGALAAILCGAALAALCFRFRLLRDIFTPFITVVKSTPISSFIILVLLWIGRDWVPSWIAALIVLPAVYENLITGFGKADIQLLEMARIFEVPKTLRVRRIYISAAKPYFFSACRLSLGLAWKAGIAAEVLSLPRVAIGKYLYESKLYLETVDLFSWTLTVILLSLVIERIFVSVFEKMRRGEDGKA